MSYCYQNQPLDLSCHKNRAAVSPSPLFTAHVSSSSPPPAMIAALGFPRRTDSSSDNDDDDDDEDHHQSPDSAVDAVSDLRIRRCFTATAAATFADRRSSPTDYGEEEEEEEGERRSFGYNIGPRKRFLTKFYTAPQGE